MRRRPKVLTTPLGRQRTTRPDRGRTMIRLRIDLAYDGTAFAGWARQPGQRTVQGVLEDAFAIIVRPHEPPQLTVAGRTDAGGHARGQVAHLDVVDAPPDNVVRRLNGVLPSDVRVRSVVH